MKLITIPLLISIFLSCSLTKIKVQSERNRVLEFAEEYVAKTSDIYNPLIIRNYPKQGQEDKEVVKFLKQYENLDSCCVGYGKNSGRVFIIESFKATNYKMRNYNSSLPNIFEIKVDFNFLVQGEVFASQDFVEYQKSKIEIGFDHLTLDMEESKALNVRYLSVRPLFFTKKGYLTFASYQRLEHIKIKENFERLKKQWGYICNEGVIVECKLEQDVK